MDQKLNKEYVAICKEMRVLNRKRYEIFKKFKELHPTTEFPRDLRTPSFYRDLYDIDLDE